MKNSQITAPVLKARLKSGAPAIVIQPRSKKCGISVPNYGKTIKKRLGMFQPSF